MSLRVCDHGHIGGTRICSMCNKPAGKVKLGIGPGRITVTTRAGRLRDVTVAEFRALKREVMRGGPFNQGDFNVETRP
jgi:hypothetical protein